MGEAENCLSEVSYAEDVDGSELLMWLLEDQFSPKDQTDHFQSVFNAWVQHPNKDAPGFGHALKQLGLWTFSIFPAVEVRRSIVKQFVNGILDYQMHCHLQLQKPSTVE